ncbi:MAG TPA: YciI family protein [Methylomirabilota bacterium]|nr:YciI family protein [Methylomirabilota bacterium]
MIVYHVAITTADDYVQKREPHREAHLERLVGLRARGLVIGGGPSADGRGADVFYRVPQPDALRTLVEEDPYFTGGAWPSYSSRSFAQFLEPWELPPLVTDGSRPGLIVEGVAPDVEMASFALIEARGAGRMAFGGFFPGGLTLAVMRGDDPAKTLDELRATGLWEDGSLRARPWLYVL